MDENMNKREVLVETLETILFEVSANYCLLFSLVKLCAKLHYVKQL